MKLLGTHNIPLGDIDLGERLREVDGHWVEALGALIKEQGQLTPIMVVEGGNGYKLVAGTHRVVAMTTAGFDKIRAEVYDAQGKDIETLIRLAEIDENLMRHELTPLDRGVFLAQRKVVYEALNPETKKGGDLGNQHTGGKKRLKLIFSFSQSTADKLGLGIDAVTRACRIGGLPADIRNRLSGTEFAKKEGELYNLTKVEPTDLPKVVKAMLRTDTPAPSVAVAAAEISGQPKKVEKSKDEKNLHTLRDTFKRSSPKVRKEFLAWAEGLE